MTARFLALAAGLAYAVVLMFSPLTGYVFFSLLGGVAAVALLASILRLRGEAKGSSDYTLALLPLLWILGTTAILLSFGPSLAPSLMRLLGALGAGLVLVQIIVRILPPHPQPFWENVLFLSAIGGYYAAWVTEFYFAVPWWIVLLELYILTFLLLWLEYFPTPSRMRERLLFSGLISFLAVCVGWGMLYWPLHYVTLTAFMAGGYYLAASVSRIYLSGSLTTQKIIFYLSFTAFVMVLVLATAAWLPRS